MPTPAALAKATEMIRDAQIWLRVKYTDYDGLTPPERRVLAAAYLNDLVKPVEATGHNDGPLVAAILANVGLNIGNPWCAAAQAMVADIAHVWRPSQSPASVMGWVRASNLAIRNLKVSEAKRGDLVAKNYGGGKGHIGIVVRRLGPMIWTIEGNTGSGNAGSQRDGQGMYRRARLASFWDYGIRG